MYDPRRFSHIRLLQAIAFVAALFGGLLLVSTGLGGEDSSPDIWMIAAGLFGLSVAIMLTTFAPLLIKMESTVSRQLDELRSMRETVAKQSAKLESIVENTRISDAVKSFGHRTQEIEALKRAIREEIQNQRWEAAVNLAEEMEQRFGYKQDANDIREELDDARRSAFQAKLSEAIELIETHFRSHEWQRAGQEIDRLLHALPNDEKVLRLQERMKDLQEEHKRTLRAQWHEAVRRSDTDHAIDVLRELDQYLSSAEAQELQESARHVFKEKLLQLGIKFRFAVTEKRWHDALSAGLELVREFPNARMANEVREALDTLRERARPVSQEQPTSTGPPSN